MAAGRQAACLEPDNRTDISDVINGCLQRTWVAAQERQLEPVGRQLMQPKFAHAKKVEKEMKKKAAGVEEHLLQRGRERKRGKFVLNSSTDCGS